VDSILTQYEDSLKFTSCCNKQRRLFEQAEKRKEMMSFDTETTGVIFREPSYLFLNEKKIILVDKPTVFGISMAIPYGRRIVLTWGRLGTPLFEASKRFLGVQKPKVAHNARYDLRVCEENGIKIRGEIEDTYTMSRIFWDRRRKHSLQALSEFLCPELSDWEEAPKRELSRQRNQYTRAGHPKNYVNYSFLPDKVIGPYAITDAFMDLMLYRYLEERAIWR